MDIVAIDFTVLIVGHNEYRNSIFRKWWNLICKVYVRNTLMLVLMRTASPALGCAHKMHSSMLATHKEKGAKNILFYLISMHPLKLID